MNIKTLASIAIIASLLAAAHVRAQEVIPIRTFDDLLKIGHDDHPDYPLEDVVYELAGALDAGVTRTLDGGAGWRPIGTRERPFNAEFRGAVGGDWRVYVISGLYINRPESGDVGLFGVIGERGVVNGVGVAADITGSHAVGTLAGTNYGTVTRCFGGGVVRATRQESNAGGLVGVNGGTVTVSYSEAAVYGEENVGGFAGYLTVTPTGTLRQVYAHGDVSGTRRVGGLVGRAFAGTVDESYSVGKVSASGGNAGGLVGEDFFTSNTAWNRRGVDASGNYIGAASVTRCFWDRVTSGYTSSFGGTNKTTPEMMRRATFTAVDWDFDETWVMEEGAEYPHFIRVRPDTTRFTWQLAYSVNDQDCGRLRITANGFSVEVYEYNMPVLPGERGFGVEALPWEGCEFVEWSDDAPGAVRSDVALGNAAFSAVFRQIEVLERRTLIYIAADGGRLRLGGVHGLSDNFTDRTIPRGTRGPVAATVPQAGWRFTGWSDGDASVVRTDLVMENVMFTAEFTEDAREAIAISSYDELNRIGRAAGYPLDGYYELTASIDASASRGAAGGFAPIGTVAAPFRGVFRGNGNTISGLYINRLGDDFVGLFGYADNAVIVGVYVDAEVTGRNSVGALVGAGVNTVIDSCAVAGTVRGVGGVGGLMGRGLTSVASHVFSTASVSGTDRGVGGLVGISEFSMVTIAYTTGVVAGSNTAGGLVGSAEDGEVQYAYASGSVSGQLGVGGLIGEISHGVRVLQCYTSAGVVGMSVGTGGFAGVLGPDGGRVSASYWDVDRSGRATSSGGRGESSANMMSAGTYAGWNFDEVWGMGANGYPYLRDLPPLPEGEIFHKPGSAPSARPVSAVKPTVRMRGKNLHVNAPPAMALQVRLIDMRGRMVGRYDVQGGAKISLSGITSGRYVVDIRENGKRVNASRVIVK